MTEAEEAEERAYMRGQRMATRRLLSLCMRELEGKDRTRAGLLAHLEDTRAQLHDLSIELGCDDWPDGLHLGDVLSKYILPAVREEAP